jgi:hypothetical protein
MQAILLFLLLSFTALYIFTRTCFVRIKKFEKLKIEIHLQILAYILTPVRRSNNSRKDKNKSKSRRIILAALEELIKNSMVVIHSLKIPYSDREATVVKMIRYRIYLATLLSYIDSMSHKFILCDNALTLSPDISSIQYDVSIRCRLYQLIYNLIKLGLHKLKEKIYVRE